MCVTYHPLKAWNKLRIPEGPLLLCRRCGASQDLTDVRAFNHKLGCPLGGRQAQYPCSELAEIMKQKIQAELF